jgi:hypothetical protein
MGYGVKTAMREFEGTTDRFNRLSADQSPQHFLNPFQRQDIQNRMSTLSDLRRNQTETAIAQRTRDTVSPQHQQLMAKLSTGASGEVGSNMAKVDIDDLQMGEQKKQERLRNLQQLASMQGQNVQMKQAYKTQAEAEKAAKKAGEESKMDKFLGKYTLGGKLAKSMNMSPTQLMMTAAGAAVGGPMGAQVGSQVGGAMAGQGQAGAAPAPAPATPTISPGMSMGPPAPAPSYPTPMQPSQMQYANMFGQANSAYMGY